MNKNYILEDSCGNLYNSEFMPNSLKNGSKYGGYSSDAEQAFYYYFAVFGYDIEFDYEGKRYRLLNEPDRVIRCDYATNKELEVFVDGNDALKRCLINGIPLLKLINNVGNIDLL